MGSSPRPQPFINMSTPRIGHFPQNVTITWSDGTPFSGYAYVALIMPTYSGTDASYASVRQYSPPVQVPNRIPIPIKEGLYNNSVGLFYNADLVPPNTQYEMCLFDTTKRQVTSFSSAFTVSTDPINNLPSFTPTVPSTGSNVPQPNS